MPRLYRPHIPTHVKVQVAEAAAANYPGSALNRYRSDYSARSFTRRLADLLRIIADGIGCEVKDLRLDHDPPLAMRRKRVAYKQIRNSFLNEEITKYFPDANDPEHLFYRPHGAQFAGSHDVKTRIRGDHGQYSDIQLIKRERRRQRRELKPEKKTSKIASRATNWPPKRKFPKRRK